MGKFRLGARNSESGMVLLLVWDSNLSDPPESDSASSLDSGGGSSSSNESASGSESEESEDGSESEEEEEDEDEKDKKKKKKELKKPFQESERSQLRLCNDGPRSNFWFSFMSDQR